MTEKDELSATSPPVDTQTRFPDPASDWTDQKGLAELLSISEKTACCWAKEGRLAEFEHGFPHCGRRKYSRTLVRREIQHRWQQAIRRQDESKT
jgi:hypothetical protein